MNRKSRRLLIIAFVAVAFVVAAALILALIDFESPEIGQAFLDRAGEATGLQLTAEKFHFNLIRGLVLEDLTLEGELRAGNVNARISKMVLEHRLIPLLFGKLSGRRLHLEQPEIEIVERAETRETPAERRARSDTTRQSDQTSSTEASSESEALDLEISELKISNGSVSIDHRSGAQTFVEQLDLNLDDVSLPGDQRSILQDVSGEGSFQAAAIEVDDVRVKNASGDFKLSAGKLNADPIAFETEEGEFRAEVQANFNPSPFEYQIAVTGDPVHSDELLGQDSRTRSYGPAKFEFVATGAGTQSANLNGKGKFTLSAGTLPASAILSSIDAIARTSLVGAPYKATATNFRVEKNAVHIESFTLETEQAALDLSGAVSFDGPVQLDAELRAPRRNVNVKEIPNELLNALTDQRGWVSLPFRIQGSRKNPRVSLDTVQVFERTGSEAKDVLKKKVQDRLRDFLEKRLDD